MQNYSQHVSHYHGTTSKMETQRLGVQHPFNCKAVAQITWWKATCLQVIVVRLRLIAITLGRIGKGLNQSKTGRRLGPHLQSNHF